MALRTVRLEGDSILRKISKEVKKIDSKILDLLDDMQETMAESNGVGLAAVQVGSLKRIFIADIGFERVFEFINPEILEKKGSQIGAEGCLSIPEKTDYVDRPTFVKIRACDRNGVEFILELDDFYAVVVSHEFDHLEGVLYIDKTVPKPEGIDDEFEDEDEFIEE